MIHQQLKGVTRKKIAEEQRRIESQFSHDESKLEEWKMRLKEVYRIDVDDRVLPQVATMGSPRVKPLQEIYCIGGQGSPSSTYIYEIAADKWRKGPEMQTFCSSLGNAHQSTCVNSKDGRICIFGGCDTSGFISRITLFDPATLASEVFDPKYSVYAAGTFMHDGLLYVVGGLRGGSWVPKISTIDLGTLHRSTFVENVFDKLDNKSSAISHSCFDGLEFVYMASGNLFIRVSIVTKEIKCLKAPTGVSANNNHQNLVYCASRRQLYLLFGQSSCYYNIDTDQWHDIAKPPVELYRCGIVGV
eukprot:gene13624-16035_t